MTATEQKRDLWTRDPKGRVVHEATITVRIARCPKHAVPTTAFEGVIDGGRWVFRCALHNPYFLDEGHVFVAEPAP